MECVLSVEKNVTYERYTDQVYMFIEQAPRDICESILYRPNVSDIIIIDSLGMICPFLFRYADRKHNTNAKKSAEIQICNYLKYGMDMETKLPYHGYSLKNNIKVGIIGWGRAVGWLMVTLADSFNYIKENEELVDFTRQFVENVKQYIRADGSFSWQLVAKEGFGDSSATAMIGYGLSILDNNCNVILEQINNYLINGIKNGKDTNCSGESGGYGVYSQNYGSFPWGTGSILSFCSRYQ